MSSSITIIIPVFNESGVVSQTTGAVISVFEAAHVSFTLLIVDDGSTDATWAAVDELSAANPIVRGLRLSRNFGKENAIFAGLSYAEGDCVIVMDGDLQHPPETALDMYCLWEKEGFDIVEGVKRSRQQETTLQRISASAFYTLLKLFSGLSLENMSDFKLLSRYTVDIIKELPERYAFFRAITGWTGLRTGRVFFDAAPRAGGETKFKTRALFKLAVDSIVSYSSAPLQMVTLAGIGFAVFAVVMAGQTLYMKVSGRSVEGFTTVILLLLFIGGILMISLGIIGVYIAKIYHEIKKRPRYIVGGRTKNL